MSDPTAPDQPAYPPVLTPTAAAAAAQAAEPASAPTVEPVPVDPAPEPAPEPAASAKPGATWKGWAAAGAACGIVVVGGILLTRDDSPAVVDATSPQDQGVATFGPSGRGAQGEITDIDGTTLTLASNGPEGDGEVTVETDDDTSFIDVVDGDVGDIQVGDNLLVQGDSTDGVVAAERIIDNGDEAPERSPRSGDGPVFQEGEVPDGSVRVFPEGGPPGGMTPPDGAVTLSAMTVGEVTAIDGDRITIESITGEEVVVSTTGDTEFRVSREIGVADLEEGDEVMVVGERDDDVVTAEMVRRGDEPMVFGGPATRVGPQG